MKNFNIFGVHQKTQVFGGGVHEKPIYRGGCLKRGGLGQFADLRGGGLGKYKGGGVFKGGKPNADYVLTTKIILH